MTQATGSHLGLGAVSPFSREFYSLTGVHGTFFSLFLPTPTENVSVNFIVTAVSSPAGILDAHEHSK